MELDKIARDLNKFKSEYRGPQIRSEPQPRESRILISFSCSISQIKISPAQGKKQQVPLGDSISDNFFPGLPEQMSIKNKMK